MTVATPIFHLVYLSSAKIPFSPTELEHILRGSRENNARLGVTGLLLYEEGNIIQLLEGKEATVRELYQKIRQDSRHGGFIVLLEETVEAREFPDWSMAFRYVSELANPEAPGHSEFLRGETSAPIVTSKAFRLLNLFKKNHAPNASSRGLRASSKDPSHRL